MARNAHVHLTSERVQFHFCSFYTSLFTNIWLRFPTDALYMVAHSLPVPHHMPSSCDHSEKWPSVSQPHFPHCAGFKVAAYYAIISITHKTIGLKKKHPGCCLCFISTLTHCSALNVILQYTHISTSFYTRFSVTKRQLAAWKKVLHQRRWTASLMKVKTVHYLLLYIGIAERHGWSCQRACGGEKELQKDQN